MKKEKLEQIKRMLCLEDKISKLKSKYSINNFSDNALDMEKTLNFLFDKITSEEQETLNLDEREYFISACLIPLEDIEKEIKKYDNSSPKMDEIKFIDDLSKKYNVEIFMVKRRIRDLRKIQKIDSQKQKFDVLAVPCDRAFVISPEKTEAFLSVKPNPEIRKQQKEMAETFRRNNLVEEDPVLKKTRKPNKK